MKAFGKILAAALVAGAAASPLFAQASDQLSTTGSVRIIQPIDLIAGDSLAFGTIVRPSSGSNTFTIGTGANTVAVTGAGNGAALSTGTKTRASYTATGEGGQAFTVTLGTLSMTGPGTAITVALTPSFSSGNLTGTLGTTGAFPSGGTLYIGGAFTIADTQASGDYSGSFTTTLAYN